MKRKTIAMLMVASMTVALFAGCGSKSDESDSGKVKLTFLDKHPEDEYKGYFEEAIADFEKENPDIEIEYEEFYGVCDECKTEIFVPGLDDRNEEIIEEEFRKKKNLITISDIKKILEKYNVEKRPLSKLLGFGELTITRYIDGQLPSAKYQIFYSQY